MMRRERIYKGHRPAERKAMKSDRISLKLTVCLVLLGGAMLLRLLFPEATGAISQRVLQKLSGDADYAAALEKMGSVFMPKEPEAQYAVQPEEPEETPVLAQPESEKPVSIGDRPDDLPPKHPIISPEEAVQNAMVEAFLQEQAEFEGYDLPDKVDPEYYELGFDYAQPVEGTKTSAFGYRIHPVEDRVKFHYGLDFGAAQGTEITAFAQGTVLYTGESSSMGIYVAIEHPGGVKTQYGHCSKVLVSAGDKVEMGQTVALVGETGNATAPCLHFELYVHEKYVNPEYYL